MRDRLVVAALAIVALAIGVYLSYERSRGRAPVCPIGGGCATVQASRYAQLAGVPVSTLGSVGAFALLATTATRWRHAVVLTFAIAATGAAFSLYLTSLEAFVIDAWCAWCVASATTWVGAAVVSGYRVLRA